MSDGCTSCGGQGTGGQQHDNQLKVRNTMRDRGITRGRGQGRRGSNERWMQGGARAQEGCHMRGGVEMRGGGWGAGRHHNNQLNKRDVTRGGDQGAGRQHDNQAGEGRDERTPVSMINGGRRLSFLAGPKSNESMLIQRLQHLFLLSFYMEADTRSGDKWFNF